MKRLLCLIALLLLFCLPALAEDITAQVTFTPLSKRNITAMTDRDYTSNWTGSGEISMNAPVAVHGIYLNWAQRPSGYTVQGKSADGQWQDLFVANKEGYLHEFVPVPGYQSLRFRPKGQAKLAEIYLFGEGELPTFVQQWQPTPEKADLLLLIAHPDDEVVMFGGLIPTYAGQMNKKVLVACLTNPSSRRASELLNSLWTMGLREYPVWGTFRDKKYNTMAAGYNAWGQRNVRAFVVELYRRYQPEVVVTHDIKGEYGHSAHMVAADVALAAVKFAANPENYVASYQQYGAWQVKKLYWHLAKEGAIEMDWDIPLDAFLGQTSFEVAKKGYEQHKSQHQYDFRVYERTHRYSTYRYGLVLSTVGPDALRNDFLENIKPD